MSQTQLERDAAHLDSTSALIIEVLEAQKVPMTIAVGAVWRAIMDLSFRESNNSLQFLSAMRQYLDDYDTSVPLYLFDHLKDYTDKLDSEKKVQALISLLRVKPENVIIKDGKVVDIRS